MLTSLVIQEGVFGTVPDNYCSSRNSNTNNGSATALQIGWSSGFELRSIKRFDVSSIPAKSKVDASSSLVLNVSTAAASAQTFYLHRLTQAGWTEGGSTWNKYDGITTWTTAGGDYDATIWQTFDSPTSTGTLTITGQGLADFIADALLNRSGLLDILIRENPFTTQVLMAYSSSENATSSNRPKLTVVYTHPAVFRRRKDMPRRRLVA